MRRCKVVALSDSDDGIDGMRQKNGRLHHLVKRFFIFVNIIVV
jgi:hypothetical protein